MAISGADVRGLQERAARGLPAEYVEDAAGWWLRHSPGCSWWVGTVLPHGEGGLGRRVAAAERFYTVRGTPTRFQICPQACPAGLDAFLAERGYRREGSMSLQTARSQRVLAQWTGSMLVQLEDHPTTAWFDAWHAVNGGGAQPERDLLARVRAPSAYASAIIGGSVVAVGRAVADTGWAGVFGMATRPEARGKGAAREVLGALAAWAAGTEIRDMYLQVEHANVPAMRLYARAGFSEVRAYHYRTCPRA